MTAFSDALRQFQVDHASQHPELSDAALDKALRREQRDSKRAEQVQNLAGDLDALL